MNNETQKYCEKAFETHKATLIQDTDRYLIIDWRKADGSGDYYVNYIVDKKRGSLIVSGDLGDSIATWYNPITPQNLKNYVWNVDYYMGKFQCASNKYKIEKETILEDIKKNLFYDDEDIIDDFDLYTDYEDEHEFWDDMEDKIEESIRNNEFIPTEELTELIEKFDEDYFEWLYDCGKRTHIRVYLWAVGFNMACEQLGI